MTCDVCANDCFEEISHLDRLGKPLRTVICRCCGLVSHMPIPSERDIAAYYAERYRQEYHGEQIPSARRVMRAWKNAERIHRQLRPYLRPGMDVFEIGAGIGCTVKVFEMNGFDARGIEPGQGFSRFSREKLRAKIDNANLFDLQPGPEHDLILLIHVIEHFISPTKALDQIHAMLKPGGRLYVECPNLAAPFATFPRLFHYAHIYNFTPQTLIALAEKCGFGVEKVFSRQTDPDIQILFTFQEPRTPHIDPHQADRIKMAIHRYNLLTYHLRWSYLRARMRKLSGYLAEAMFSERYVKELLQRCQQ